MNEKELKTKLDAVVSFFRNEISQIRTGRATPALFENIIVPAYGSNMTLKELATIAIPDSQTVTISPWDKSLLTPISNAIIKSELQLNPSVGEDTIRLLIPALTEERRIEFTKLVGHKENNAKQSIRNIRQDTLKLVDKAYTNKEIGEDEKFTHKDSIEVIIKDYISQIDAIADTKKTDLLNMA
ncbi:ribosome recycling factor [candidate division WWE3 bacterium]|uniref:Ribosome recycling factor n=1 Tax=candidate division WWE3 bacterium TaxID=2053526 RepID=A0A955J1N9_UNCKA|nr:ribosome recycling factor [candidate division WWE3 bacterium]